MTATRPVQHRSAAVVIQADATRCVLSVNITHTRGYPHHQVDFCLEIDQTYDRIPSPDELLAIAARLIEAAQSRRGRAVARPTPTSSVIRQRGAAGAPRRGATGGGAGRRPAVTLPGDRQDAIPGL